VQRLILRGDEAKNYPAHRTCGRLGIVIILVTQSSRTPSAPSRLSPTEPAYRINVGICPIRAPQTEGQLVGWQLFSPVISAGGGFRGGVLTIRERNGPWRSAFSE
jgi:hypothetical protein